MKPRQIPWKWLLLGLITLLIVGLAVMPRLVADSTQLSSRVTDALSAWSGGEVRLTGPLRVHYFPDVSIKSGFELTNASRLPLVKSISAKDAKVSIDLAELMFGRIRIDALRLLKPEITLKDVPSLVTGPDQTLQGRVANLLKDAPIGVLRLRDGTLYFPTATGTEAIKKIDARFDASSGTGAMSSLGSFALRDETVGFALDCGAPVEMEGGIRVPVNLTFTSKPLAAKLAGTASFANGFQLDGDLRADMENARRFFRWAGIPLPPGRSLNKLTAAGTAHWNGTTLTFDDGTFSLDGNAAVGLLAVTPAPRPRIDATLDFDRLAIDPYFGGTEAPPPPAAQAAVIEGALLKYFDADLRISAAEITAPMITLGRGGFTISTRNGVLASEVGELELCGGEASGRVGIDMSQEVAKASLTASLVDVPVDNCLDAAFLVPLKGNTSLKAEMSGEGRSYAELIQALAGTLTVNADAGAIPLDLARLLMAPTPLDGDGWSRNSVTLFDSLNADCRLGGGHIWCDMFNMQTRRGMIAGSGNVDLAQATLDWNLFVASNAQPLKASQLSAETPPRLSITGALAQPMIRRTDRPTLGDGSVPTGSTANQISPR
ncbi:MAG: AsmA family protein [Methyloceanibacter sp.]